MTDTSDFSGLTAVGSENHDRGLSNHREDPAPPVPELVQPVDTATAWRDACAELYNVGKNPNTPTPEFDAAIGEVIRVHNARVIGDGAMLKIWETFAR